MGECVVCNGSLKKDPDPDKYHKTVKICVAHDKEIKAKLREWVFKTLN